jgi:hypothetical protein
MLFALQEAAERALAAECTFHPTVSRRGQSAPPARPSFLTADGDSVTEKIDEYVFTMFASFHIMQPRVDLVHLRPVHLMTARGHVRLLLFWTEPFVEHSESGPEHG